MKSCMARAASDSARRPLPRGPAASRVVGAMVAVLGFLAIVLTPASPASAHGGDPSSEGYVLVQQALGHLAHDTSATGIQLALEKVDAALAVEDQEGVAVAEVKQAKSALEAGQPGRARALLQHSITEALSMLGPATGEETGTTVVVPALPGRYGLTGRDWGFLAASMVLLLAGVWMAYRFRPGDSIGELRRRSDASHRTPVEREL